MKIFTITLFVCLLLSCQTIGTPSNNSIDLKISENDIYIEKVEKGYMLYVNKKADIKSIKIFAQAHDQSKKNPAYGLRTLTSNNVNGNEKWELNEKIMNNNNNMLIDSTPERNTKFTEAFTFFFPYKVTYGDSNTGTQEIIEVVDGMYINICTFPLKFCAYEKGYMDNSYLEFTRF